MPNGFNICQWSPPRIDRLRQLAAQKLYASQIANKLAEEFGIKLTKNAVIGASHRYGVKLANRRGGDREALPTQTVRA